MLYGSFGSVGGSLGLGLLRHIVGTLARGMFLSDECVDAGFLRTGGSFVFFRQLRLLLTRQKLGVVWSRVKNHAFKLLFFLR